MIPKLSQMEAYIPLKINKSSERVDFEYGSHLVIGMDLVRQVDKDGALIKEKDDLINQRDKNIELLLIEASKQSLMLQRNATLGLHKGRDNDLVFQS